MCTNREEQNGLRDEPENSLTIGGSYGTLTKVGRRRVRDEHGAEPPYGTLFADSSFWLLFEEGRTGTEVLTSTPEEGSPLTRQGSSLAGL